MPRPYPIHQTTARLIYQIWQDKMCAIGEGHMVYDWAYMPGDVRQAWEDSVSVILNEKDQNLVKRVAESLSVPVNVRCDRPHR